MANTDVVVTYTNNGGIYLPAVDAVSLVAGDTVCFSTSDGSIMQLYFSADAPSVLSPRPANPLTIAAGQKASFTFTSSASGAYSVFFEPEGRTPSTEFPSSVSGRLLLLIDYPDGQVVFQSNPLIKG